MDEWVQRKQLRLIRKYVSSHNRSKYHAAIIPIVGEDNRYSVIFSRPTRLRPVPAVVVNTIFNVNRGFLGFEIEEDTQRRRSDMHPFSEAWIDLFVMKKQAITKVFDMSDAFTKSRTAPVQWWEMDEDEEDEDDERAED